MGHLSPVCDSSRMIARRASLRDARRKINFRIAGRNYLPIYGHFACGAACVGGPSGSGIHLGAGGGGGAGYAEIADCSQSPRAAI